MTHAAEKRAAEADRAAAALDQLAVQERASRSRMMIPTESFVVVRAGEMRKFHAGPTLTSSSDPVVKGREAIFIPAPRHLLRHAESKP